MSKPYSDAKKVEVVTTYLALGKIPMVEAITGVNRDTIKAWKMQPWWKELVNEIQTESDQELDTKLSTIIQRSLDAVNERIEHGEFILDSKTGKVIRLPVKLRDAERVAVDLLDKRDLLRGRPAAVRQQELQTDILSKLATQFSDWVKVNIKKEVLSCPGCNNSGEHWNNCSNQNVVRGQLNAIHDKRPQGLQDGVQQVSQPEKTEDQSSGT